MNETNHESASDRFRSERVPSDERPGHEQVDGDDPTIATHIEDPEGTEWFIVGNDTGVVCTSNPVPIER
ncbi:hypothetical protein [Halosimplex halophilum]|uniref:hypothetical protein n=1 Tax=Halosimplex halophilum TaxID=2559572 RepID=UPI00107F1C53|nr:hypothetical protein [Halosimplex halophilum]